MSRRRPWTILLAIVTLLPVLMMASARAQVIASDDFSRADETPFAVGGNWGRVIAGNYDGVSNLVGNQVTSVSKEGIYYWQGAGTFDPTRQFARQRVVQKDGELGLVLLGGFDHAIMVAWGPPGVGNTVYIYWYENGADRGQLATGPSTLNNGDIIEASLEGGVIYAKVNGVVVKSVANTTTLTTGTPGFITYLDTSLPGQVSILDDWEAGTPASYTISGTITENAVGLSGVFVTASGGFSGSATTGGNGAYTISGVPTNTTSIVLTPTLGGHTMSPLNRTVSGPVVANVTGEDFTSTQNTGATLTILASHGSVTRDPDATTYSLGTEVTLTPVPEGGYDFSSWSGNVPVGQETANPLVVTMDQDRTITANFFAPGAAGSDDFNRANEFPLIVGGNWQRVLATGQVNLNESRIVGASGEAVYYWQGAGTFDDARQYARSHVVQAGGQVGLVLLGANNQAIVVSWGGGRLYIYWYLNGIHRGELANEPSILQNGDQIEAVLDQGRIYAKVNGVVVKSVANTTSLAAGHPGFETYLTGAIFDDWESGIPPVYTIGGTVTENAAGLSGVLVTASGGFVGSTTTGVDGVYSIPAVPSGATSIVLTPTLFGHTMSPATRTVFGPVAGNVAGQDFASTPNAGATLTVNAVNGTVTKSPDLPAYGFGADVVLTPTPDPGQRFAVWSGDVPPGHETDDPLHVTMDQDRTITASFLAADVVAWDFFNRANESPVAEGGNWQRTQIGGFSNLSNNRVVGSLGEALYKWQGTGNFDGGRQFARARVAAAGGQVGLVLLGATNQALVVAWNNNNDGGTLYIYWYSNATHRGNLKTAASTILAGDLIEARLEGGTIYAKINGSVVASVANTTTLAFGTPGFETYLTGGSLDDWEAGPPPCSAALCDDGNPCTDDGCDAGTGACTHTADDTNACSDGIACTTQDACLGGSCVGVPSSPPGEAQGLRVAGVASSVVTWTPVTDATYDVVSSSFSDLRANGPAGATCIANDVASGYTDGRPNPAPGVGYYYLIRAQTACGSGTYGLQSSGLERLPTAACP